MWLPDIVLYNSMYCVTIDSGEVVCVVTGYRAVQQVCVV